jgi:hypothetical protein
MARGKLPGAGQGSISAAMCRQPLRGAAKSGGVRHPGKPIPRSLAASPFSQVRGLCSTPGGANQRLSMECSAQCGCGNLGVQSDV